MISDEDRNHALNYLKTASKEYAQAKSERRYLEEFRKTLKARLFLEAPAGSVADREAFAYAHEDYDCNLIGLKAAVAIESELFWKLKAAEIQCDHWRTEQANNRRMDGGAA